MFPLVAMVFHTSQNSVQVGRLIGHSSLSGVCRLVIESGGS